MCSIFQIFDKRTRKRSFSVNVVCGQVELDIHTQPSLCSGSEEVKREVVESIKSECCLPLQ